MANVGRWSGAGGGRGECSIHAGGLREDEKKLGKAETQHRVTRKPQDDQAGWAGSRLVKDEAGLGAHGREGEMGGESGRGGWILNLERFDELGVVPGLWHRSESQLRLVPVAQKPKGSVCELCGRQLQPQGNLGQGVLCGRGAPCPPKNSVGAISGTLGPLWQCNVFWPASWSAWRGPLFLCSPSFSRGPGHTNTGPPLPFWVSAHYHFKLKGDEEGLSPV